MCKVLCLCNVIVSDAFSAYSIQKVIPDMEEKQPEDSFDLFVKMRSGLGTGNGSNDIVFWTGEGEIYESPSGKLLAKIDGMEVSKAIYLDKEKDRARIFSRKIFWYRDKDTNEIITEFDGMPVQPIRYDWQVFDVERSTTSSANMNTQQPQRDPLINPLTIQAVRSPRLTPPTPITPRIAGSKNQLWFNIPLFLDFKLPGGRGCYQAWELYDYSIDATFPDNRPPSLGFTRNGSIPPFVNDGRGVMHFQCNRVNTFDELSESLRSLIETDYVLFRTPPSNIEEVDRLIQEGLK